MECILTIPRHNPVNALTWAVRAYAVCQYLNSKSFANRQQQQTLPPDGANFSQYLFAFNVNADDAPQLKTGFASLCRPRAI